MKVVLKVKIVTFYAELHETENIVEDSYVLFVCPVIL
jgi:hypothetical protein